jgi:Protein of unknown function, DUF488
MKSTPPRLSVLPGGGASSTRLRRADLALLEAQPAPAEQRTLAAWASSPCPARLLSVGISGLTFDAFQILLADAGVHFIIDLRHLAAFRGHGFSTEGTHSALRRLGIGYERCYELRNGFAGSSSNHHAVLQRYAAELRDTKADVLDKIVAYLRRGPVLLLGPEPTHAGTEREVVATLIGERFAAPLEVLALTQQGDTSLMRWSSLILEPHCAPLTPDTAGKNHRRHTPANQLSLTDDPHSKR